MDFRLPLLPYYIEMQTRKSDKSHGFHIYFLPLFLIIICIIKTKGYD